MHKPIRFMAYSLLLLVLTIQGNTTAAPKLTAVKTHALKVGQTRKSIPMQDAAQDTYNCCIKSPCAYCKNNDSHINGTPAGQCHCFAGVNAGKTACIECHGGWEAGQGTVPGKTKKDVRKMKMAKP